MKKYKAKSVKNGEYKYGSVVVFEDSIKTDEPYDEKDFYKGLTNTFIVEIKEMKIDYCLSSGYVMKNIMHPVIPDTVEEY